MINRIIQFCLAIMALLGTSYAQNFEAITVSKNFETPTQMQSIDLNSDGLDDVIALGYENIVWFENTGIANFIKHKISDTLRGFRRFNLFDKENDGDMDIFFTADLWGTYELVAYYENDGNQNFTFNLLIDSVVDPYDVKAFDIDMDTDIDILFSSTQSDELYWLVNNSGIYNDIDTIGQYINRFEIADFNGDNDWDIIYGKAYTGTSYSSLRCYQNDGSANFTMITLKSISVASDIIVEDIDGDNDFDILLAISSADMVFWLENDGAYDFNTQHNIMVNFDGAYTVDLKDVNQDGKKDVIAGSVNSEEIYLFMGSGSISSFHFLSGTQIFDAGNYISDIVIGNFDNQNNLDFMHCDQYDDAIFTWINDGNQSFTSNVLATYYSSPRAFDMKDIDGDGDQDIASVSNDGDFVSWFENMGDNFFENHVLVTNYEEPYTIKIIDLDLDGDQDIVSASDADDKLSWWENTGNGNFTMYNISTSINGPRDIAIEDFDQDGDIDIAVIGYATPYSYYNDLGAWWFINDGFMNFTADEINDGIMGGRSIRAAEMTGDSLIDLVISSYYYGDNLYIGINDGTGFSTFKIADTYCEDFEVVDFDFDNDNDVITVDFQLDSVYFWENLGNYQFQQHTLCHYQDLYRISVVDYDNDNDYDIIFTTGKDAFTNGSYYGMGIFYNDSSGFILENWYQNQSIIKPSEVYDFENDGDYDVLVGYDYAAKVTLYKNLDINCLLNKPNISSISTEFCLGDSTYLIASSSDSTVAFQWLKDGVEITGEENDTIVVSETGYYSVQSSDSACAVISNPIFINAQPAEFIDVYASICPGDAYEFDTLLITNAGDYIHTYQSNLGCDSTVNLHLSVAAEYSENISATICQGSLYNFFGTNYSGAGTYYHAMQTINGCDSTFILELSVNPFYYLTENYSICSGDSLFWEGDYYLSAGTYYANYQSIFGCDSTRVLYLSINPDYNFIDSITICEGDFLTWQSNSYTSQGSYFSNYNSVFSCDSNYTLVLNVNPIPLVNYTISEISYPGANDAVINLNISSNATYVINWSTGDTDTTLTNLSSGIYYITVTDSYGCSVTDSIEIEASTAYPPSNWNYTITSGNHTIMVQSTANISISGHPAEAGDFIGVFYDSAGTQACGGYILWTGSMATISAWGEESGLNNGFTSGEELKWKIWDASEDLVLDATPTYSPSPPMPNTGYFAVNGMSGLAELTAFESQTINLIAGWSMFSTYIFPNYSVLDSVFSEISSSVVLVKNYQGSVYWPQFAFNSIGSMEICEGYQIKMLTPENLIVTGISVIPENNSCTLVLGWSIISYLRKSPAIIETMLNPIVNDIIVVKDYNGFVYWPAFSINTIGNMKPGEGYQIKMQNQNILTYPAN